MHGVHFMVTFDCCPFVSSIIRSCNERSNPLNNKVDSWMGNKK